MTVAAARAEWRSDFRHQRFPFLGSADFKHLMQQIRRYPRDSAENRAWLGARMSRIAKTFPSTRPRTKQVATLLAKFAKLQQAGRRFVDKAAPSPPSASP
mgnify:CR=1 FL=1